MTERSGVIKEKRNKRNKERQDETLKKKKRCVNSGKISRLEASWRHDGGNFK